MRDFLIPLAAVAAVGIAVAALAATHPILARLAARNALRRRSRVLIVTFGLLIGTMIVSSSLSVGDTLEYIFTGDVYSSLDAVDVTVTHDVNGQLFPFPETHFFELRDEAVRRGVAFDGMAPALQKVMPVRNNLTGNQGVTIMGLDDAYEGGFGSLVARDGRSVGVSSLPADRVYVNEAAALDLNASVGNQMILFGGNTASEVQYVTVEDIVRNDGKGGYLHQPIVFAPLAESQAWFNATGTIDVIRVSAPGPAIGGELRSAQLARDLALIVSVKGWDVAVRDVKGDGLADAQRIADQASELFLVMGSFAIFAGILLIVNVFVMLAEERKPEMGVARAVGMKRLHLTLAFLFEGALYVLLAAAAGALAGVGLGWTMIQVFNWAFPPESGQSSLVFHVDPASVLLAFAAGVLLTIAAVAIASTAISRLNVVRAIRNLPEPSAHRLSIARRWLVFLSVLGGIVFLARGFGLAPFALPPMWPNLGIDPVFLLYAAGVVVLLGLVGVLIAQLVDGETVARVTRVGVQVALAALVGVLAWDALAMPLVAAESPGAYRIASVPVLSIGLAVLAARRIPARIPFTASGLATLWWLLLPPLDLVDEARDDVSVLFVETGVLLVMGAVLVAVFNTSPIIRGALNRFAKKGRPVVRAAVAYPMAKPFRTGMTLAMFALTIFSITVIAMVQGLQGSSLDRFIEQQSGGYQLAAYVSGYRPIANTTQELAQKLVDHNISLDHFAGGAAGIATATVLPVRMNKTGSSDVGDYTLWGVDNFLIEQNTYAFREHLASITYWNATTARYDAFPLGVREDVWRALRLNRSYAAIDRGAAGADAFTPDFGQLRLALGDHVWATDPVAGNRTEFVILGILEQSLQFTQGVFVDRDTVLARYPLNVTRTAYFFQLAPGVDAAALKQKLESEFLDYGLIVVDIRAEITQQFDASQRVLLLMQAYLALGLLVGVTGLGVITIRAVVERRQEIGAMRALGFTRRMIRRVFLFEISLIAVLGIAIGVGLGILLAHNVFETYFASVGVFTIPYAHLAAVSLLAYAFTLLTTASPALRASRLPPAQTLRYIE